MGGDSPGVRAANHRGYLTLSRPQVLSLLADNGIRLSRALGQNFVADPNTVRRMARLAGLAPGDRVLEVGAGLGSLTLALAETGARVLAVEKDKRLVPVLRQVLAGRGADMAVQVLEGDAMALEWAEHLGPSQRWVMVSNLPYNIATPLVADLLDGVPQVGRMTFMVQAEVADRLVASVGSDAYGAVSVKVAYWAEAKVLGEVPPSVFVPRPNVGSSIVELRRRPAPAVPAQVAEADKLFALVRTGFAHRRKMLRRALAGAGVGPDVFERAGVLPEARAEQLSVHDWGRLAHEAGLAAPGEARPLLGRPEAEP